MRRAGFIVVLLAGTSCTVTNPLFAVDEDEPIETEGPGPSTTTQGVTGEPTGEPGTTSGPGTSTDPQTGEATTGEPEPVCGDGVKEGSEPCDDGNDIDTDDCLKGCVAAVCGDGVVHKNLEACDDGNQDDDDDCTNECKLATCGDGIMDGKEQCDDGNGVDDDLCSNLCLKPVCGDGIEQGGEQCDDGNAMDDDECVGCKDAFCGDSKVWFGVEECDDGNNLDTDACTSVCANAKCGDGHLQPGEMCDEGPDTLECQGCKPPPVCGDGFIWGNEQCDPKAPPYDTIGVPLCNESCKLTACFGMYNTPGEELPDQFKWWLSLCAGAVNKPTVVVTLLDDDNQVVYMAKGAMVGDWTANNMTAGNILHSSEYEVNLHERLVLLKRFMPDDGGTDVLMVTSAEAVPGNDMAACYNRLADGYGIAVYPKTPDPLPAQKPKMLVMGTDGASGVKRFEHFNPAKEISYDEAGMDVCVDTKPFQGSFLLSLFGP